jgi:CubicO group peptidase (beta-lactamase class C family)
MRLAVISAPLTCAIVSVALPARSPLSAQAAPSDSAILAVIQPRVDAGRYAGVAVGVVTRDNQRRVITYGPNVGVAPFDGNTVFEIGSITKTFTAAILADMVRKGQVSLTDPVQKYLPPSQTVPSRNGKTITLLDLATQSSGLPRMPDNMTAKDNDNPYADYTVAEMYAFLAKYALRRDPGAQYEYSNLGVGLLGHVLALRAGKSYEATVTDRVLSPLGMTDTRVALTADMKRRMAPGHTDTGKPIGNWDLPTLAGAGALRSTVNDMLTYIRANADSLSKPLGATLAMTHAERHAGPSASTTLGLAWHRTKLPSGRLLVWHNGGTGGYRSFTGYDEVTGVGVVVLTNTSNSVDEIGMHLLDPSVPLPSIPKARKEIALPVATLERYVGVYDLAPTFSLTVTREGTRLFTQATGQSKFEIFAEAEDEFFVKVLDAQLSFTKDANGAVVGIVLHQNGQNVPGTRKP